MEHDLDQLRECLRLMLERENDVVFMRKANNSYIAVSKLLYTLQGKPAREFDTVVTKAEPNMFQKCNCIHVNGIVETCQERLLDSLAFIITQVSARLMDLAILTNTSSFALRTGLTLMP